MFASEAGSGRLRSKGWPSADRRLLSIAPNLADDPYDTVKSLIMKAEIIAIGNELVSGQRVDTNSQWLSQAWARWESRSTFHTSIGDDLEENVAALRIAIERADLVVTTGGLGPTQDDLTREALAARRGRAARRGLRLAGGDRGHVRPPQPRDGRAEPRAGVSPDGAEPLPNRVGTAPGSGCLGGTYVACLPGVPYEMRLMFDEQVVPAAPTRRDCSVPDQYTESTSWQG